MYLQIDFELLYLLVSLSSPVKFSNWKYFFGAKFRAKFEAVLQKQFLWSVAANGTKLEVPIVNWVVDSDKIRSVYSTDILSSTATIR